MSNLFHVNRLKSKSEIDILKGLIYFSILYTVDVLLHVEWCIRLTALVFFNHTL